MVPVASYLIVGSGYRAEYYARIAARYPDRFRALFLCRSEEKARLISARTGVGAVTSAEEARAFCPDFVVVAVDRDHVGEVTGQWAVMGYPVVAETPVGSSVEELTKLWTLEREHGAKIVCCEQYHRYPLLARGLALVKSGWIGTPVSAYLSLAHDYHGFSLIRRMLGVTGEDYALRGVRNTAPVLATDSRAGAILDGALACEERDTLYISFSSGKTAIYDFSSTQYRSFIRSRHLILRGEMGEWCDRIVYGVDEENRPRREYLMPEPEKRYMVLDTQGMRDLRKTWQGELFLDTLQDEFAVATILLDMEDYIQGGPSPYPLREALEDAHFWLLAREALKSPFHEVPCPVMPWREG